MSSWKQLYRQLPPFLRHVAASVRGYKLKQQRYGPETEKLVVQALERDYWSVEQWETYHEEQLAKLLHRAATKVPYYREYWEKRRSSGDQASWEYLENWPILYKYQIRNKPKAFLADDSNVDSLIENHTSGTTGKPIHIYRSQSTLRAWYALVEARWRRWYNVDLDTPWAILGGQLITPIERKRPPYWVWNEPMKQLYMSSYHIAPDTVSDYLRAIQRYGIKYIYCYTSSAHSLADAILRQGVKPPDLRMVITNAEPVYTYQREKIVDAFGCPVYETYGQTESVMGAGECESGNLHLWPDAGYLEILENEKSVRHGTTGDTIVTGLLNKDWILIRYDMGDRMALHSPIEQCSCGRRLPMIQQIEGRSDDVLFTSDGRRIGRLDPVFKSNLPIHEAQIIQDRLDHLLVRVVPTDNYTEAANASIREQLQLRMGNINVDFEVLDAIPRTKNGKFRAVINNLSPEERAQVE